MTDQTDAFDADKIVPTSINAEAARNEHDAQADDDQRWIETVLTSLNTRSHKAQQALLKVLLDGQKAVTSVGHVSGTTAGQGWEHLRSDAPVPKWTVPTPWRRSRAGSAIPPGTEMNAVADNHAAARRPTHEIGAIRVGEPPRFA